MKAKELLDNFGRVVGYVANKRCYRKGTWTEVLDEAKYSYSGKIGKIVDVEEDTVIME